jgi:subtilase family serine protease
LRRIAKRRALVALGVALAGILIAMAAFGGSARGDHAVLRGAKTPAVGAHPKWAYLGGADAQPNLTVFSCQTRPITSPLSSCYGPDQIQRAYGIKPFLDNGQNGAGRTIVIIDAYGSPTITSDLALFDSAFNLPAPNFTTINMPGLAPFDPNDANQVGWSAETSLDVEWAHAVAPGANIVLVVAKSNNDSDILDATQYVLDHNLGDVVSQSFGEGEQCMDPALLARQHEIFDGLSAKGVTLFASSGDSGAAQPNCDGSDGLFKAASTPASDPDVTGVGGTQLNASQVVISGGVITNPGGAYIGETTWNEGVGSAGGGGFSVLFKRPDFQAPIVKDSNMRAVPDVAYNAAVQGGVIAFWSVLVPGGAFRFGGTSAGAPQWAGLIAIADQLAGGRVGNINKTLYKLGKKNQGAYFHDVTTGDNSVATDPSTPGTPITGFSATGGFDEATGWGSPIAGALLPAIATPGNG